MHTKRVANMTLPTIGFLVYPGFTGLDLFGPHEILARVGKPLLVAQEATIVHSEHGVAITPDIDFSTCPPLDIFVVPGGPGCDAALANTSVLHFVRERSEQTYIVATICTGALILAATGSVKGMRMSTHWLARTYLAELGAIPTSDRVVIDGKYWSSAGVSAGIDLALRLAAHLTDETTAQQLQLEVEYDPQPPFDAGDPQKAPRAIVERLRAQSRYRRQDSSSS